MILICVSTWVMWCWACLTSWSWIWLYAFLLLLMSWINAYREPLDLVSINDSLHCPRYLVGNCSHLLYYEYFAFRVCFIGGGEKKPNPYTILLLCLESCLTSKDQWASKVWCVCCAQWTDVSFYFIVSLSRASVSYFCGTLLLPWHTHWFKVEMWAHCGWKLVFGLSLWCSLQS